MSNPRNEPRDNTGKIFDAVFSSMMSAEAIMKRTGGDWGIHRCPQCSGEVFRIFAQIKGPGVLIVCRTCRASLSEPIELHKLQATDENMKARYGEVRELPKSAPVDMGMDLTTEEAHILGLIDDDQALGRK